MKRIEVDGYVCPFPLPVSIFGVTVGGKPNWIAISWLNQVNGTPTMYAAAINKRHLSNSGIRESGTFSINIPSDDMVQLTDYCGLVSGKKVDKSGVFDCFYGELETAPMISQCPFCIECKLADIVELPSHDLFIGKAVAEYSEERYLRDGKPDFAEMRPFLLSLGDNRYWSLGHQIGKAWGDGVSFK